MDTILYLAASAENGSEHPLAKAVLEYATQRLESSGVIESLLPPPLPATAAALAAAADGGGSADGEATAAAGTAAGQQRSVAWLAPIITSESLPGRGLKCWLLCPAGRLAGRRLGPPIPTPGSAGSSSSSSSRPGSSSGAVGGSGGGGGTVEVRLTLGNRRLMREEGITLSSQARGSTLSWCVCGGGGGTGRWVRCILRRRRSQGGVRCAPTPSTHCEQSHNRVHVRRMQLHEWMRRHEHQGATCVLAAVDGRLAAALAISDSPKPEAPATIAALRWGGRGWEIMNLTVAALSPRPPPVAHLPTPSLSPWADCRPLPPRLCAPRAPPAPPHSTPPPPPPAGAWAWRCTW